MAENIYPESIRENFLANMYCEIAMESYFHATKYHQIICEKNFSALASYEKNEMCKHIVKTVVFAAMSIESFLNNYAAACLGDAEFYSNFEKLSALSKFKLIAQFILKSDVEKDKSYYSHLKKLFSLRDSYVHNKSKTMDLEGFSSLDEYLEYAEEAYAEDLAEEQFFLNKSEINNNYQEANLALKAIKEIALYFDDHDAQKIAMSVFFHPLGSLIGSTKEQEYKSMVFSVLNIKADKYL